MKWSSVSEDMSFGSFLGQKGISRSFWGNSGIFWSGWMVFGAKDRALTKFGNFLGVLWIFGVFRWSRTYL
jgi:hypothetical protein